MVEIMLIKTEDLISFPFWILSNFIEESQYIDVKIFRFIDQICLDE